MRYTQENTPIIKIGSKMVKVQHLTDNQAREMTTYIGECHTGPWMGMGEERDRNYTAEEEMPQWIDLFDLMDSHAKLFISPTNSFTHGESIPDPRNNPNGMYHNDETYCVEADVTAFVSQVAHKLLMLDPGLKKNMGTEELLTRQHFVPPAR